ncbi:sigma-70 family RNA polymerase sigma factor [Halocella sp. SP3-1]|uniref:sigma-70 family RNA polymerase sigma factor n=1 Tax=Halocella sp. SP3-1 TaxID=2382161 RepID=UPI0013E07190|nr:sigma-70 family RNA polymerase sigma factor [Halocella sp. SP3-1]
MNSFEPYKKYCMTGDEYYLQEFFRNIEGLLNHCVRQKGFYSSNADDVVQEIHIQFWKAADSYNHDRAIAPFIRSIINNTIATCVKARNRIKRKLNENADSLNKEICDSEGKKDELIIMIPSDYNLEETVCYQDEIAEVLNYILSKLSKMEKDIYKLEILSADIQSSNQHNYDFIMKNTNYTRKQIDNAKRRIRKKLSRLKKDLIA